MAKRSKREWWVIGGVLVALPVVLCGVGVFAFARLIGGVDGLLPFSCPREDWHLAEAMTTDGAAEELMETFPEGPEPNDGCDEDDRTVSADVERRTGLSRDQALRVGGEVLKRNGWRDLDGCYSKEIAGREVWADLTYRDEYRSDPESDLLLSIGSVRDYYC